eukprot:6487022-Amphidinium_carterae.1
MECATPVGSRKARRKMHDGLQREREVHAKTSPPDKFDTLSTIDSREVYSSRSCTAFNTSSQNHNTRATQGLASVDTPCQYLDLGNAHKWHTHKDQYRL